MTKGVNVNANTVIDLLTEQVAVLTRENAILRVQYAEAVQAAGVEEDKVNNE